MSYVVARVRLPIVDRRLSSGSRHRWDWSRRVCELPIAERHVVLAGPFDTETEAATELFRLVGRTP